MQMFQDGDRIVRPNEYMYMPPKDFNSTAGSPWAIEKFAIYLILNEAGVN